MFRFAPILMLVSCFYVTAEDRKARFDLDGDGVPRPTDCDDADDGIGEVEWYADLDGDGHGDPGNVQLACEAPTGFVGQPDDCDDDNPNVRPGALEQCNGVDDDCNGEADDGVVVPTWFEDNDGDGQGDPLLPVEACSQPEGAVANSDDCDDGDAKVKAGGIEIACNDVDDDCDALVDFDDPDVDQTEWTFFYDGDGDLYGTNSNTEVSCTPSDDFVVESGDCDDADAARNPGATEVCGTGDDNCDGVIDPYGLADAPEWYPDADGDGFGDNYGALRACAEPFLTPPYVWLQTAGDCDDTDACVFNGAQERCNGNDDDCDTVPDDGACVPVDTGMPPGGQCW